MERIEKILGRKIKEKIVLYAPTWRGETGNVSDSTERLKNDVEELMKELNEDAELLIKVHHLSYDFLIENGKELSDIVIPEYYETNELLNAVDVLITDYSSIFFEYIPLKRPIIYYVYDKESYISERGLYLDLEELPGVVETDVKEVSKLLKNKELSKEVVNEKYDKFIKEYCPFDDGGSTKRVIDLIFEEKIEKEKKEKKKTRKLIYVSKL